MLQKQRCIGNGLATTTFFIPPTLLSSQQPQPLPPLLPQDIEDMQHRQGYIRGAGALDKNDLLYLRDYAATQREQEMRQRDHESSQFASLKAR